MTHLNKKNDDLPIELEGEDQSAAKFANYGPNDTIVQGHALLTHPEHRDEAGCADSIDDTREILKQSEDTEKRLIEQIESLSILASENLSSEARFDFLAKHARELEATKHEVGTLHTRVVELDKAIFAQIQRQGVSEVILSTVSDAIISIMDDGMIRDTNTAGATLLGCDAWEALGEPISNFFDVSKKDPPSWLENFSLLDGLPPTESAILREDATSVPIAFRVACTDVDGERIGILTMHDLSEVKLAALKLEEMHKELVGTSRKAGMAEIATGILHNVGNVLNSVTVSSELIEASSKGTIPKKLQKVAKLLEDNVDDLPNFLAGGKAKKIIAYINECATRAAEEQETLALESANMRENVDHIRRIIARQQEHAGGGMAIEQTTLKELVMASYRIVKDAFSSKVSVGIPETFPDVVLSIDTPRTVQIITNLIKNAGQAIDQSDQEQGSIEISCEVTNGESFTVAVRDDGIGISPEQMKKMFGYGYTTKNDGHGFGLHDAINSANTMRGNLSCTSEGTGKGATFLLILPLSPKSPRIEVPPSANETDA